MFIVLYFSVECLNNLVIKQLIENLEIISSPPHFPLPPSVPFWLIIVVPSTVPQMAYFPNSSSYGYLYLFMFLSFSCAHCSPHIRTIKTEHDAPSVT